jgi:hypothetical protein
MAGNKYWFARRYPVGNPRSSVGPISTEGWLMAAAFVLDMLAGAVVFFYFASIGETVLGGLLFGVLAAAGAGALVFLASRKSDQQHTIDDYKSGRVR